MTRFNLLLLALLMGSCVYLVKVSYEARRLFAQLDRAQAEERQLDVEHGRLQAERQTQAAPSLVEKTARSKLGMRSATPAITQYVADAGSAPVLSPAPAATANAVSEPAKELVKRAAMASAAGVPR